MGFGGAKKTTNTAEQATVSAIQAANAQIIAANQQQAAAQAAVAKQNPVVAPSAITKTNKNGNIGGPNSNVLGVLDFIKTAPSGLRNQPKSGSGRLTVLGN